MLYGIINPPIRRKRGNTDRQEHMQYVTKEEHCSCNWQKPAVTNEPVITLNFKYWHLMDGGREEFVLHGIKCQLVSNLLQGLIYELNF